MDVSSDNLPIEGDILVIYANDVVKWQCDGKMFSCISQIFGCTADSLAFTVAELLSASSLGLTCISTQLKPLVIIKNHPPQDVTVQHAKLSSYETVKQLDILCVLKVTVFLADL